MDEEIQPTSGSPAPSIPDGTAALPEKGKLADSKVPQKQQASAGPASQSDTQPSDSERPRDQDPAKPSAPAEDQSPSSAQMNSSSGSSKEQIVQQEQPAPAGAASRSDPQPSDPERLRDQDPAKPSPSTEGQSSSSGQTVDNSSGPVKGQVNVQGSGAVNIFNSFSERPEDRSGPSKALRDPTKELPSPSQIDVPAFPIDEYADLGDILERRRIILLSSFDHQIAFAAAYALVRLSRFDAYERRLLVVMKKGEGSDLSINLFSREEYHDKKNQLILIEISHPGSFTDSLRTGSIGEPAALRDLLHRKNLALVCATSCEVLGVTLDKPISSSFSFDQCLISFLDHKLAQSYSREHASQLKARLEDQRQRKLWADFPTIEDFYREVASLLSTPGQLEEQINRRESLSRELSSSESIEKLKSVRPVNLFTDGDSLRRTVLYTATYFRNLNPDDFGKIVCLILGGETVEVEKQSKIVSEKGKVRVHTEPVPKPLVDLWREAPDRILAECSLEMTSRSDSLNVLDFSKSYLRRELRYYLESKHPMFLAQCFNKLQEKDILFQLEVSDEIVENVIRIWIDQKKDLDKLLLNFFIRIAALGENETLRWHFYDRLCQLIREMLQTEALRGTVHRFLDFFFRTKEHDTALDIVLELAERLRFAPEFEAFFWMKRLLDEGGEEIEERTYQSLFGLAKESGIHLYDVLEAIRAWLPEPTHDRYSPSNTRALSFLPEYCFATAFGFLQVHYGEWPTRYALFAALPDDLPAARAKLDLLAEWLTHPGLSSILQVDEMASEELLADFIADLVEIWVLILEGTETEKTHPEASLLANALLEALAVRIERPQRTRLLSRWQWGQQAYYKQVNLLAVPEREERNKLLAKRKKLLDVKRRFLEIGQQRP